MADSTAFIDTTSIDATTFIYVDDSTSAITAAESATAQTLVNDFDAQVGPMEKQGKEAESSFNSVIDFLSSTNPLDFTPENLIDDFTRQALDASYASSSWMKGASALNEVGGIKGKCSLFSSLSAPPKYGDLARQVESMRTGVVDNALSAIGDVAASFAEQIGRSIPELSSAKKLSDTSNTGRSTFDTIKTGTTSAVSAILETGKAGMAKAGSVMGKLAGPMKLLDSISNCANTVGGSDYIGPVDDMLDKTQGLYDKMYMYDDPTAPTYGEFNQGAFETSIPTVPRKGLRNVMKLTNMYNKSNNNSNLAVDVTAKAAKEGEKSTSSLAPNTNDMQLEDKRLLTGEQVKVETTLPAVPAAEGREAYSAQPIEAPEPETVPVPPYDGDGSYGVYDPNDKAFPAFASAANRQIPTDSLKTPPTAIPGSQENDGMWFTMSVFTTKAFTSIGRKPGPKVDGKRIHYRYHKAYVTINITYFSWPGTTTLYTTSTGYAYTNPVLPAEFNADPGFAALSDLVIQAANNGFETMDPITSSEIPGLPTQ